MLKLEALTPASTDRWSSNVEVQRPFGDIQQGCHSCKGTQAGRRLPTTLFMAGDCRALPVHVPCADDRMNCHLWWRAALTRVGNSRRLDRVAYAWDFAHVDQRAIGAGS